MKTISIHTDVRGSKKLEFSKKKNIYNDLYTTMARVKDTEYKNMKWHQSLNVGDGVIITYKVNAISNGTEIMKMLEDINDRTRELEGKYTDLKLGSGVSYGISHDFGSGDLISYSIDGASTGANLANKCQIDSKKRPWVLPLIAGDDGDGSISDLENIIINSGKVWFKKSLSKKNLWFEFEE